MHAQTASLNSPGPQTVFVTVLLVIGGACAALLGTLSPLAAVGVFGVIIAGWLLTRSIDWATYAALFLIYANLPAVAVKYHGVPSLAANAVVGLLLLPLAYFVAIRRRAVVFGPSFPWLVGFSLVQLLGVLCADQPERAWNVFSTFLLEGGLLYLLVVNAVRTRESLRGATWAVLLAGCLMGGVPIWQQLTGNFESEYGGFAQTGGEAGFETGADDALQFRLAGPIGEKNRFAQVMLMLVPLAVFRLRDERSPALRGLAAIALICASAGVFLAFSRSTILCVGLVIVLAAVLNHVSRFRVAVAIAVVLAGLLMTPQYRTRLASLADLGGLFTAGKHSQADGALKGRATEMGAAALVFVDHPLVGVGPGQFKYYSREYGERIGMRALVPERQAHCLPLDVAAETGLFGLICLIGLFGGVGSLLWRTLNTPAAFANNGLSAGYFYMLVVYATTGLFLHFAFIRYFWLMIALTDAAARIEQTDHVSLEGVA